MEAAAEVPACDVDDDLRARIEANLPLVRHIVFQVAVHFPRHVDAVRSADWAPRSVRTVARSIEQAGNRLTSDLGRTPTQQELAGAVHVAPEELVRLQSKINRSMVLALDHPVGEADDEVVTLGDTIRRDEPDAADDL